MAKLFQMPLLFEEPGQLEPAVDPQLPQTASAPDASQRRQALDIQHSWIVEAPAGSGKTGLLIQRFLKLLAHGKVEQPDEILAITFTRKADAEMRRRVMEQLAAAAENLPLPASAEPFERTTRQLALAALDRDRALNWHLLQDPKRLNIRTIDSLCAELAASGPLLAGPGGRYTPTKDPDPLYALAAQRTLLHMGGADPVLTADLESLLLHRDASPGDFSRLLAGMLAQREQWGELIPLDPNLLTEEALNVQIRPRLTHTLERLLAQELQAAADAVGPELLQTLATLAHTLSACPSYNGDPHLLSACRESPDTPGTEAADLPQWRCLIDLVLTAGGEWRTGFRRNHLRLDLSTDEQQRLQYMIAGLRDREQSRPNLCQSLGNLRSLPSTPYPDEQWRTVKALCRVLRQALLELQLIFTERRCCDFAEIALTARTLLRSNVNGLLQTSTGRLRHLLVDEMQDTSAGQYHLLEMLTHRWDGATQTVFLVGDPKQSVYEFRQARVERFLRVMQEGRLGELPLGALRLTANFRSQAALVESFNSTFCQVFPSPDDLALSPSSADVPFITANATRPPAGNPGLHWHLATLGQDLHAPDTDTAAAHARLIRDTIEAYLSRPQKQSATGRRNRECTAKIAVLARNRAHLAPVIQAFRQDRGAGPLAFRAVDVETLGERPEILDLLALTRALLHPGDRVAWLALLRSPACGLNLADLLTLTGEGAEADPEATLPHLVSTRGHLLTPAGRSLLQRTWAVLARALDDLGRTSLATHVERTWRCLGADAPLEPFERDNALRFLNLLHELESGPDPLSLSLLNRRLRTLYSEPNAPEAPVELMTIHKAKGLEWDLVLVPALHRGSGRNPHEFLKWLEFDRSGESSADFLLAPIQGKGEESSALSQWLIRRQTQRIAAEAKRLLYVACTRARERVHLFATISFTASGALANPKPDSLLQAAWAVVQPIAMLQGSVSHSTADVLAFPGARETAIAAEPLALAAAADEPEIEAPRSTQRVRRLPLGFDPLSRFLAETGPQLPYPRSSTLQNEVAFSRPQASFAARAFGNTVHRFLAWISTRLNTGQSLRSLLAELPSWEPRLFTALRSEGLSPGEARAEAQRTLRALQTSLQDPAGAWLLAPHAQARNESSIDRSGSSLRADRTFQAGSVPLADSPPTHLWIVDYKTAELGGRSLQAFLADQRMDYLPQMDAYASAATSAGHHPEKIMLALYFPLVPALLHWPATPEKTSTLITYVSTDNTFG